MKYLLDTGVFLLAEVSPEKLSRQAQELLLHGRGRFFFSAAGSWEISIKHSLGKLELPAPPMEFIPRRLGEMGMEAVAITHLHALTAGALPLHHQDPFDRMLIAQARLEEMTLLTTDRVFEKYDVDMVWCGR